MADILNIPKEDFEHVADIASEPSSVEKEPAELILAAISQSIINKFFFVCLNTLKNEYLKEIYIYFTKHDIQVNILSKTKI